MPMRQLFENPLRALRSFPPEKMLNVAIYFIVLYYNVMDNSGETPDMGERTKLDPVHFVAAH